MNDIRKFINLVESTSITDDWFKTGGFQTYKKPAKEKYEVAKLADHSGSVDTSWGEKLHYNPGEDYIVRHSENDYGVVKKDIFHQTYDTSELK